MPYLLVYAGTIVVSKIMDIDLGLQVMKDVADAGYRIDTEKLKEFTGFLSENVRKQRTLYTFLPIANVVFSFVARANYENRKEYLLNQMSLLGIMEEMTPIEKELYNKRRTKFNALHSSISYELRLNDAKTLEVVNDDESSKIYYDFDKSENINILKVEGDASRLSLEEQVSLVKEYLNEEEQLQESHEEKTVREFDITPTGDIKSDSKEEFKEYLDSLTPTQQKEFKKQLKLLKKELRKINKERKQSEKQLRLQLKRNK